MKIQSNHPNTIKRELLEMIDKRISEVSCNKVEFDKAEGIYEIALNESNSKVTLNFNEQPNERMNRNRKITWFDPP